jgi:hypothetical protein
MSSDQCFDSYRSSYPINQQSTARCNPRGIKDFFRILGSNKPTGGVGTSGKTPQDSVSPEKQTATARVHFLLVTPKNGFFIFYYNYYNPNL